MRRASFTFLAFMTALAFAPAAEAQRAAGPFSGILGAITDPNATQTLTVRGSLFGAWDDTLSRSESGVPIDERFLQSGGSAGGSGSIEHARHSRRLNWQSSAATTARFYSSADNGIRAGTFNGQTSLSTTLSRRMSLSGSGSWAYSPYYGFAPGFDDRMSNAGAFGGGFGVGAVAEGNTTASGSVGLSTRLSRRDTLSIGTTASRQAFLNEDESIRRWAVNGQIAHAVSSKLGFHVGYGREMANYQFVGHDATSDSVDVGVDYGDTLMFDRRTSLTFRTSTSAIRWNDGTHYRLNGNASLTRGFGRTGSAGLSYVRDAVFDVAFAEPVLRDQVSGGISNQFNRRTTWSAQAGYLRGGIGFGPGNYSSYSAGAAVNVAVTRRIGMFTDYSVYRYEVPAGSTVFTSLPKFSRQSVSIGLSLWAPVIADKRSSRDSR